MAECPAVANPQMKLLELMVFNLGSCAAPDAPACTPKPCADLGAACGLAGDGCGGTLSCGTCAPPLTCGGGGTSNVCG